MYIWVFYTVVKSQTAYAYIFVWNILKYVAVFLTCHVYCLVLHLWYLWFIGKSGKEETVRKISIFVLVLTVLIVLHFDLIV